ncbi:MAG: hypothetical protein HOO10_07135 [Candidatus Marinimicrobia bacterium]|jgi:hypothetical protein|nr:hypothetical protein [Candidatus Neomarinimicrobiota bacterium]
MNTQPSIHRKSITIIDKKGRKISRGGVWFDWRNKTGYLETQKGKFLKLNRDELKVFAPEWVSLAN